MTDPTADNQESERIESAQARRPGEENHIRVTVRDIVNSLEKSISRYFVAAAVLFPILFILTIILFVVLEVPEPWGIIATMVVVFSALGIVNALAETRLPRRAARRFAEIFPEGSSERADALATLSKIKTRNKAGQKLLQALTPPTRPVPAVPATSTQAPPLASEETARALRVSAVSATSTQAPPARGLLGCLANLVLWIAVIIAVIGITFWLIKLHINQYVVRSVSWAILGSGLATFSLQLARTRPPLKDALIHVVAYAILWALMGGPGFWILDNYGLWAGIAFWALLIALMVLVSKAFKLPWQRKPADIGEDTASGDLRGPSA